MGCKFDVGKNKQSFHVFKGKLDGHLIEWVTALPLSEVLNWMILKVSSEHCCAMILDEASLTFT